MATPHGESSVMKNYTADTHGEHSSNKASVINKKKKKLVYGQLERKKNGLFVI